MGITYTPVLHTCTLRGNYIKTCVESKKRGKKRGVLGGEIKLVLDPVQRARWVRGKKGKEKGKLKNRKEKE